MASPPKPSSTRTASCFTVLEIRPHVVNKEGPLNTLATHVTCGYTKGVTKSEAQELHERVVDMVTRYPDATIFVTEDRLRLGRPGNPKVLAYAARVKPAELHEQLAEYANSIESGPFKEWKPHVSVHVGIEEGDFQRRYCGRSFSFSIKTFWDKHHAFEYEPKPERYPRVRRVDGLDNGPMVFRDTVVKASVDSFLETVSHSASKPITACVNVMYTDTVQKSRRWRFVINWSVAPNDLNLVTSGVYWYPEDLDDAVERAEACATVRREVEQELKSRDEYGKLVVLE